MPVVMFPYFGRTDLLIRPPRAHIQCQNVTELRGSRDLEYPMAVTAQVLSLLNQSLRVHKPI